MLFRSPFRWVEPLPGRGGEPEGPPPVPAKAEEPAPARMEGTAPAKTDQTPKPAPVKPPEPVPMERTEPAPAPEKQAASSPAPAAATPEPPAPKTEPEATPVQPPQPEPEPPQEPWMVRGELFHTYVVVEQGDKALLIDKHAAHERANFDRLKAADYQPMVQELLTPAVLSLPPEERQLLLDQAGLLARFGFEVEEFEIGRAHV